MYEYTRESGLVQIVEEINTFLESADVYDNHIIFSTGRSRTGERGTFWAYNLIDKSVVKLFEEYSSDFFDIEFEQFGDNEIFLRAESPQFGRELFRYPIGELLVDAEKFMDGF